MAIAVRHLSKRYGTFQAVDDVSFVMLIGMEQIRHRVEGHERPE